MRTPLFLVAATLFLSTAHAQWEFGWARQNMSTTVDHGTGCAVAPDGHVAVGGSFNTSIQFGTFTGTVAPGNGEGGFVANYDAQGNFEWAHALSCYNPGGGHANVRDVAVDGQGDVFASGNFNDSLLLDGVKVATAPDSLYPNSSLYYMVKFTPDGTMAWATALGIDEYTGTMYAMAVDAAGDAYVVGLDGGEGGHLFKLDGASGAIIYDLRPVGSSCSINDVATDAANNVYIVGQASNLFTMGGMVCPYNNALGSGSTPLFVGKFNSAGLAQWFFVPDQSGSGYGANNFVAVSPDGRCFVTTPKYIRINDDTLTDGNYQRALFALNPDGTPLWARTINETGQFTATSLTSDLEGNAILAGQAFAPSVNYGDTTYTYNNNFMFFLGRFDGNTGALTGALNGPVVSELPGLDVGSDDVPVLCGTFSGQIDLGDQIYGNWDMFVAHLAPSSVGIRPAEARAMGLQLFPNPAHGSFKLRFDHPDGAYEVSVLDAHGAVVLERKVQAPEATFQLAAAPGLYLVRAVDQAGHEAISRLEVQ